IHVGGQRRVRRIQSQDVFQQIQLRRTGREGVAQRRAGRATRDVRVERDNCTRSEVLERLADVRQARKIDTGAVDATGRGFEQAVVEVLERPKQVELERVSGPRHVFTGAGAVDAGGAVEAQRTGHT